MSPYVQLTSEQLKEIVENGQDSDKSAREVHEQVQNNEEVLDPDNTSVEWNSVLHSNNNKYKHKCLDDTVRQLNAHPVRQSTDDLDPRHKYSIPGLPQNKVSGARVLGHMVHSEELGLGLGYARSTGGR